ncbi:MAG: 50S ribosomal protein L30 [Bacteroidia bacterium]|nr:50S ribosomal protein L30 [Bacteroidia bacterium]MDW8332675.1 50S ribosomal protein L30 [Bacteroidia bacterium]
MKVKITQVRSIIGRPERQKRTMRSLGLGKINRSVVKHVNPQILGMIRKVSHLVLVEEV